MTAMTAMTHDGTVRHEHQGHKDALGCALDAIGLDAIGLDAIGVAACRYDLTMHRLRNRVLQEAEAPLAGCRRGG